MRAGLRLAAACLLSVCGPLMGLAADESRPFPFKRAQTIVLEGTRGRLGPMDLDPRRKRLFAAAPDHDTLAVVDLRKGVRHHTLTGFSEPRGVLFLPQLNRIVVAGAKDGVCKVFDGLTYEQAQTVRLTNGAARMAFDPGTDYYYAAHGNHLAVIGALTGSHLTDIVLSGYAEDFVLEREGERLYAAVPDAGLITVVDRKKRDRLAEWQLKGVEGNRALALDEKNGRLFAGFAEPATLMVFDTASGGLAAELPLGGEVGSLAFDSRRGLLYAACASGTLQVFRQTDADHYELEAATPTVPGARYLLWSQALDRLYLAVPEQEGAPPEVRVYAPSVYHE